jgi:hypothetical protein
MGVSQLSDSVIAMKFDSSPFHSNVSDIKSDCYACDSFISSGVERQGSSRAAPALIA